MVHWGDLIEVDWERRRVRVLHQRIHHGPVGIIGGAMLFLWGLTDLPDRGRWFVRGSQS